MYAVVCNGMVWSGVVIVIVMHVERGSNIIVKFDCSHHFSHVDDTYTG